MAFIDRIKFESEDQDIIVWKYPSDEISFAGQLIVNEGQVAVFFKSGQALDTFGPGRHTLKTGNVPLLENLVNLPFGGKTPFTAEVWYVRTNLIRDLGWGTPRPIQTKDPVYQLSIPVRAHGKFSIKISDPRLFVREMVGNQSVTTKEDIITFLRSNIVMRVKDFVAETVKEKNLSIVDDLSSQMEEISLAGKAKVQADFNKYGLEIQDFFVENIDVPEDDPSVQKLKKIQADKLELNMLGNQYQMKRMMDIGMAAAQNEGGAQGQMMGAGMGAGMGFGMGQMMGGMFGGGQQQMGQPGMQQGGMMPQQGQPMQGQQPQAGGGQAGGGEDPMAKLQKLKQMLDNDLISQEEYDAAKQQVLSNM